MSPPNHDDWELEVDLAFAQIGDEASFKVDMERLGFTADEIAEFIRLEQSLVASTDPTWPPKCRANLRRST